MLSAFTARPIIELRQRDKSKIETIMAYGDRILVGLNTGALRIYRLSEPSMNGPSVAATAKTSDTKSAPGQNGKDGTDQLPAVPTTPAPKPTELLREVEKFSTRSVEQLSIIKGPNMLVSLSNYAVSLHNLETFEPLEAPMARTKNASCFAVTSNIVKDPLTGIPEFISRLAVAVKRRLLLWSWHESELDPDMDEIVLPESIRTVTWASASKIVCGMNSGYVLVDVVSKETSDIGGGSIGGAVGAQGSRFGAYGTAGMGYMGLGGYVPKPLAAKLADGEMLLAKDINTLFITDEGKSLEKRQIPWQSAPESIGYSYPYILALQPPAKGSLEVRNPDTLSLLQTINLPGAAQLHFPPPTSSLTHAAKGFHISSDRCVWKMGATDYDSQVGELVACKRYDEAISILNMLEDALLKNKTETLREVKMQKAELLFKQRKYMESMDVFNEDDVHAPPERVLKLFPRVIAGELSGYPADVSGKDKDKHDGSEAEVEDAYGKANGADKSHSHKPDAGVATEAAGHSRPGGFTRMFLGHRKADSDTASITSTKKATEGEDDASIKAKPAEDGALEGKDLMEAVLQLNSYLAGARARLQRVIDPVTGKLKPRTTKDSSTEEAAFKSLLTISKGDESEEQLEKELQDTFRLVDTTLFRALMYSKPTLAGSLFRIPNFCDPEVVNEKLLEQNRYNDLVDFFYGKKLHRQALELLKEFGACGKPNEVAVSLHGPERTVMYLQNLPPEMVDLILEFSEWTLRAKPELGMEVFVADTANAETLPRGRVVSFLHGINVELEVRYLEHIIMELNDMTSDFHNRLVELFVLHLRTKPRGEEWDRVMERLIRFLKGSRLYGLQKAFGLIPRDDPSFYEAQAIVLSIMGLHRQALEIYVDKIRDFAKAEEYCNRIHKEQHPATASAATPSSQGRGEQPEDAEDGSEPSIYHTLLSLYLNPSSPTASPELAPALDLLSKHGSRLPASSTLSLIPDSLPVSRLEPYFRGRIRSSNTAVNEGRVVAGLRTAEVVRAQALLLLGDGVPGGQAGRNRRVVVCDERVCKVCHKRLGGRVVIAVLPDNSVVHYGCLGRAAGAGQLARDRVGSWGRSAV